jgi:hypothetical protein
MDILSAIKQKQNDMGELFSRMDTDKDLLYNKKYQFVDYNGKAIPRSFSVTVPLAADFYKKVVSRLTTTTRQPIIACRDNNFDTSILENFILDTENEVDNYLLNRGEIASFMSNVDYVCARGICAEQHLWRVEEGVLLPDTRPLDPRWLTYEFSNNGLLWAAYSMVRSKAAILDEYGIEVGGNSGTVIDYWDKKSNITFVDDKEVANRPNVYGFVPFCISPVNVGANLKETDSIAYNAESIFWPHRDMYAEENFIASVLKAQSYESIRPALQMPNTNGQQGQTPQEYPGNGSITPVEQPILPMPRADMINSLRGYQNMIESVIQKASMSPTEYGNVSFPMSAVALARLMATTGDILAPRLQALGRLYQMRMSMIIRECDLIGDIEFGTELNRRIYDVEKLKGAYTVTFRYATETLEELSSRAAIAQGVKGMISDKTTRRTILMLPDPDGEEARIEAEEARRTNPELAMFEQAHSLLDEGTPEKEVEAKWLTNKVVSIAKNQSFGNVSAPPVEKKPTPQQTLSIANSVEGEENGKPSNIRL